MEHVISAGIIIFRRTREGIKFLILYHGRNYWNFPKGKLESEEKSLEAALREVREETGLKSNELKLIQGYKAQERFMYRRGKSKNRKTVILYLAETKQARIIVELRGHEGYGWFTHSEARRVLAKHPDSVKILESAYDFLRKKGLRRGKGHPARKNAHVQRSGQTSRASTRVPRRREPAKQKS